MIVKKWAIKQNCQKYLHQSHPKNAKIFKNKKPMFTVTENPCWHIQNLYTLAICAE